MVARRRPTELPILTWQTGQRLLEITPISLPSDMPPGDYHVRLAMYDDENGPLSMRYRSCPSRPRRSWQRRRSSPRFHATAPQPPLPIQSEPDSAGPLHLLGKWEELDRLLVGLPSTVHVSWQASQAIDTAGLTFRIRAHDANGSLLWEQTANPVQPLPEAWPAGQVLRLAHRLAPAAANPGIAQAKIELCAEQSGKTLACREIGQSQIVNHAPIMELAQQAEPSRTSDRPAISRWPVTIC